MRPIFVLREPPSPGLKQALDERYGRYGWGWMWPSHWSHTAPDPDPRVVLPPRPYRVPTTLGMVLARACEPGHFQPSALSWQAQLTGETARRDQAERKRWDRVERPKAEAAAARLQRKADRISAVCPVHGERLRYRVSRSSGCCPLRDLPPHVEEVRCCKALTEARLAVSRKNRETFYTWCRQLAERRGLPTTPTKTRSYFRDPEGCRVTAEVWEANQKAHGCPEFVVRVDRVPYVLAHADTHGRSFAECMAIGHLLAIGMEEMLARWKWRGHRRGLEHEEAKQKKKHRRTFTQRPSPFDSEALRSDGW